MTRAGSALFVVGLVLAGAARASAAPRPVTGGAARLVVLGAPVSVDPRAASTAAELSVARALYEPLFAIAADGTLRPVLARGAPELDGSTLVIALRPDVVLHDGRPLTPALVVAALGHLAEPGSRGAHVLAGVRGALPHAGRVAGLRAIDGAVLVDLVEPSVELARLFASPRAAIRVRAASGVGGANGSSGSSGATGANRASGANGSQGANGDGGAVGTGPWRLDRVTDGVLHLAPFLGHTSGRPFLDALVVEPTAVRFGAKRGPFDAELVFGVTDGPSAPALFDAKGSAAPRELVVLTAGREPAELGALLPVIDASLDRRVLATRFLGAGAAPARTLFGTDADGRPTAATPATAKRLQTTLLVSRADKSLERAATRIQLELLRVGISATIERVDPQALDERRASGRYGLMLDTVLPDPRGGGALDAFTSALSAAAHAGPRVLVEASELRELLRAPEASRAAIGERLERTVRARAGLVVVAARVPRISAPAGLEGLHVEPSGAIGFEDARFVVGGTP